MLIMQVKLIKPNSYEVSKEQLKQFNKINMGRLDALPPMRRYSGSSTAYIETNEAAFIGPKSKTKGIYTCDAWDCVVVAAVVRGFDGKAARVGMLHISPKITATNKNAVGDFFKQIKNGVTGDIEITIISGALTERSNGHAAKVFIESKKYGKIKFMNCDIYGERGDAVLIDRQGTVYYESYETEWGPRKEGWNRKGLEWSRKLESEGSNKEFSWQNGEPGKVCYFRF